LFQTGIPGFRNARGDFEIPLDRILNITTKTTDCIHIIPFLTLSGTDQRLSDVDEDFNLQAYPVTKPRANEMPDPNHMHSMWLQDFWCHFGRPFAPLQVYPDSTEFPDRLRNIMTTNPAQRYNIEFASSLMSTFPRCCTRLVQFRYGSRVYILTANVARRLKEHMDRSAARLVAQKGNSSKLDQQDLQTLSKTAPRANPVPSTQHTGKESHYLTRANVKAIPRTSLHHQFGKETRELTGASSKDTYDHQKGMRMKNFIEVPLLTISAALPDQQDSEKVTAPQSQQRSLLEASVRQEDERSCQTLPKSRTASMLKDSDSRCLSKQPRSQLKNAQAKANGRIQELANTRSAHANSSTAGDCSSPSGGKHRDRTHPSHPCELSEVLKASSLGSSGKEHHDKRKKGSDRY
jgi:hypothetical protein